ncbi:Lipoyltransferase 1 mitochondrial [Caligus rogercresseyi]|uniref:Lipoyltransferase 1 mitochondrial n=1 Tax=Caligus rogercresseyi TaxID=217165 RepID=A0A7T8QV23_CALRO|nr:Lipoyltransferase 1 mitochondrial [Caligus rogercresseyi]
MRKEGTVDVAQIMEHGSTPTVPTGKVDVVSPEKGNVGLDPRFLMTAHNHTGTISPQKEQMLSKTGGEMHIKWLQ